MSTNPAFQPSLKYSAIAQRLLAHAHLCEQIARACCNEVTAAKLKRMAQECSRTAAQVAPERDTPPPSRH
jgi:hypothetical protein